MAGIMSLGSGKTTNSRLQFDILTTCSAAGCYCARTMITALSICKCQNGSGRVGIFAGYIGIQRNEGFVRSCNYQAVQH